MFSIGFPIVIKRLNEWGGKYAIGRDVHVGDTIIGIKGRVGFEAAGPLMLIKGHHLLEKHTLSKQQLFIKDQMAAFYGSMMHEGQYLDPVMRDMEAFLSSSQKNVTGTVEIGLAPYRFELLSIQSDFDLMQSALNSYGETNKGWSAAEVKGFTKIFSEQAMKEGKNYLSLQIAKKINYNFRAFYPLILGIILWAIKPPPGLDKEAYLMFIIFASTILSVLIRAIPMSTSVLIGLLLSIIFNLMPLKVALMGFGDSTTWLVVIAFLIAGVIIDTGLGKRIALICIQELGKSVTGLGYAICTTELILGPLVPSNTARGGGIIAPIVDSISRSLGSEPKKNPRVAGEYLHLVGAHANLITAAMFLTGMAANPIISRAALDVYGIEFDWSTWALGSIIPVSYTHLTLPKNREV